MGASVGLPLVCQVVGSTLTVGVLIGVLSVVPVLDRVSRKRTDAES